MNYIIIKIICTVYILNISDIEIENWAANIYTYVYS